MVRSAGAASKAAGAFLERDANLPEQRSGVKE